MKKTHAVMRSSVFIGQMRFGTSVLDDEDCHGRTARWQGEIGARRPPPRRIPKRGRSQVRHPGRAHAGCRHSELHRAGGSRKSIAMQFLRQHKFVLSFLVLLVFCSVMVILQMDARKSKHVELREAMILLETGGYTNEADRLYLRLFAEMPQLSNKALIEDWQRTVILVDPGGYQPSNAVWRYYWTVRNEMERRSEDTIQRARKLAEESK